MTNERRNELIDWYRNELRDRELTQDEVNEVLMLAKEAITELQGFRVRVMETVNRYEVYKLPDEESSAKKL